MKNSSGKPRSLRPCPPRAAVGEMAYDALATATPGDASRDDGSTRSCARSNGQRCRQRRACRPTSKCAKSLRTPRTGIRSSPPMRAAKASVTLKLPDNLTTWTFRGVGVTADTKVGESTVEVIATKPLLIRPVTTRFFVVGDKAELAANVSNNTDNPLTVTLTLSATGVTILIGRAADRDDSGEVGNDGDVERRSAGCAEYADLVFYAAGGRLRRCQQAASRYRPGWHAEGAALHRARHRGHGRAVEAGRSAHRD